MFLNLKVAKTFALATSMVLLPAAAHAENRGEEHAVERDGVNYVYTVSTEKGRTVITGTADRFTPFRLVVRGRRVTGEYNHNQVAFSVPKAQGSAEAVAVR